MFQGDVSHTLHFNILHLPSMPVFRVPHNSIRPLSLTFIYHLCQCSMLLTIQHILITYLSAKDRALASCCCSTSQPSFDLVNPAQRWPQTSIERAPSGNKIKSLKQEMYFHGTQPFLSSSTNSPNFKESSWKQWWQCWNIAKFAPGGSHKCSHRNIKNTVCKFVGTYWINTRVRVTVSWIASSTVTRRGVTITSRSQNPSPWSGDMWIPHQRKNSRHCPHRVTWCAMSFGIG